MERKYKINNSEIKICFGDILKTKTEVIVSSDDSLLSRGGGSRTCTISKYHTIANAY